MARGVLCCASLFGAALLGIITTSTKKQPKTWLKRNRYLIVAAFQGNFNNKNWRSTQKTPIFKNKTDDGVCLCVTHARTHTSRQKKKNPTRSFSGAVVFYYHTHPLTMMMMMMMMGCSLPFVFGNAPKTTDLRTPKHTHT
jgi:hypothetical protein